MQRTGAGAGREDAGAGAGARAAGGRGRGPADRWHGRPRGGAAELRRARRLPAGLDVCPRHVGVEDVGGRAVPGEAGDRG